MKTPLKILMLEDNIDDAEIIQQFLKDRIPGCDYCVAMTKEGFIDALDQYQPDLILSDNTFPQFSATEALEIFNGRSLSIPFILVTGTVSEEFAASIIKLGADDYILKDRMVRLPAAIEAALRRKKLEAETRHSEEIRKLIMNAALDAIICIDKTGAITVWNSQAERLFGWTEGEILGKQLVESIIPEQYRKGHTEGFNRYLETGTGPILNKLVELTALNRNGNEFPIELIIVPVKQTGSDFFCAFIRDITERKKSEDRIRFKANLLNTVGQAVIATDLEGTVIYWNKAAEKIYGWSVEEATGKNIIDLTPAQQSKEEAVEIMNELNKGNLWSGEFSVRRKDGTDFPAFVTDSPIYDQQGHLTGIIGISHDISERKKAEAVLKSLEEKITEQKLQEQKKISRAIIKAQEEEKNHLGKELHDNINQILAGAKLHMGVAANKDEKIKAILKYPMELIDTTVEEIRLLSKRQVTPVKNIDLEELIQQLVLTLRNNQMIETEFTYSVLPGQLPDHLKLNIYRLLQEQVNNIMKHSDAAKVSLSIKAEENNVNIRVMDDGIGFNMNAKRKGIGISNMINRIEFYNGKLTIETAAGKGCKIEIIIPY